jgi:hypothetical protein
MDWCFRQSAISARTAAPPLTNKTFFPSSRTFRTSLIVVPKPSRYLRKGRQQYQSLDPASRGIGRGRADRKRPRTSRSSQYIIASCDFLIAQLQTAVSAVPQNPNKSVVMGASIKHRGDSWMMLV